MGHMPGRLPATNGDQRWRVPLRHLFTDFAAQIDAVLATAEVVRGVRWSGRGFGYDGNTEHATYLAPRGYWSGLPPYPVWWAWFGSDYAPLVRESLPADQVKARGSALFHWRADTPADRNQLLTAPSSRGERQFPLFGSASATPWLPTELLAAGDRSDPRPYNPPLTPATVRPASLR